MSLVLSTSVLLAAALGKPAALTPSLAKPAVLSLRGGGDGLPVKPAVLNLRGGSTDGLPDLEGVVGAVVSPILKLRAPAIYGISCFSFIPAFFFLT